MSDWDYRFNTHASLQGTAVLSDCGRYRFRLTRDLGDEPKTCCFIMLNPSTADHAVNDPTIVRCMGYAKAWGCGALHVVNLFAWRTPDPDALKAALRDPRNLDIEGATHNRHFVAHSALDARGTKGPVVCGWGIDGSLKNADVRMMKWLREHYINPTALKLTKDGYPNHPLYLSKTLLPIPYEGRAA
jgi:hypothetical protein